MKKVYFDNAATTAVNNKVIKAMLPYFDENYGNPSEYHSLGQDAKSAVEKSRHKISSYLKCATDEIIFTSSATEAVNLAHKGYIEYFVEKFGKSKSKPHIITTKIEHKAVLETCMHLERLGWASVTYLEVDKHGLVDPAMIKKTINKDTVLVSVMYVNNEVGTVEPIPKIGKLLKKVNERRKRKILFHTDATQAIGHFNCNVDKLGVDFLSFTGHKIGAPKGVGALFIKNGVRIYRQMDGGAQEKILRSGTENVPYVVALGSAIDQIENLKHEVTIKQNCDYLIRNVLKIPGITLTGHPELRAPHIASFIVKGVEGESIVLKLSERGIYVSSGSACTSSDLSPSHVLTAMGFKPEESHGSIRFSLGRDTTKTQVDYLLSVLPKIIAKLREMSPLN